MSKSKKVRAVKAWAGIIDDKIDTRYGPMLRDLPDTHPTIGVIRTRREAKEHYECVIPVLITPIRTAKRRRKA